MSNIKYNEKEEAYELPYKLWDTSQTVRFYVESEEEIMKHLSRGKGAGAAKRLCGSG